MVKKLDQMKHKFIDAFTCPKPYQTEFELSMADHNRSRLRFALPMVFSFSAIVTSFLLFSTDLRNPDPLLVRILSLHVILMAVTSLTYVLLGLTRKGKRTHLILEKTIHRSFLFFGILWTMFFSFQSQVYSDQLTVYQFGVGFVAVISLITPSFSIFLYALTTLIFIVMIPNYQTDSYLVTSDVLNSVYMLFIASFASSILYRNFLRDYILQMRIQEQNTELIRLNSQLEELSNRDALTGIHNRRFFDKQLTEEWQTAHQQQKILSLAIMDIDDFKSYNDYYGHIQGDLVLQKVVNCIQAITKRPGDSLARFGGEEFVLLLPNTDEAGALIVCNKIRLAVETLNLNHEKSSSGKVTISIGVCTITPELDESFTTFIHHADLALYEAKRRGKNRVVSQFDFRKSTTA